MMKITVNYKDPHSKLGFYVSAPMSKDPVEFLKDYLPGSRDKNKEYTVKLEFTNNP